MQQNLGPEPATAAARPSPPCRCGELANAASRTFIWSLLHASAVRQRGDRTWCLLCRSCCRSVRTTDGVSCPSTTCCLGRTPVPALPNTSMWTTNANQVSPDPADHPPPSELLMLFISSRLPETVEHKRLVVCEGGEMVLHCQPPRVLNIYAAVYGRSPAHPDTCPSHLTRPPPFGE